MTTTPPYLTCPICQDMFCEPCICDCGHSFCKMCIDHWIRTTVPSCPICRNKVTRTTANYSLRQVVEERRRLAAAPGPSATSSTATSCLPPLEMNFTSIETSRSVQRSRGVRNDRRSRVAENDEVFSADFGFAAPRRSALSSNSTPLRSSLVVRTPTNESSESQDDNDDSQEWFSFDSFENSAITRNAHFRGSDALKSMLDAFWYFLITPRWKAPPSAVSNAPLFSRLLCSYSGVNANFKRVGRGDEITILVFGMRGVGKSRFLDNLILSVEADRRHKMVGLVDRLTWSQQQTQSRELPHMTSVVLMKEGTTPRMVDVINADCGDKVPDGVHDSFTADAFVNAGDAAVLLYTPSEVRSLLTITDIHHRLATKQIPCVLVASKTSSHTFGDSLVQPIAQRMNAKHFEINVDRSPNPTVIEIVQHLADLVSQSRPP